jgi:hypothetical protein
MQTITVTLGALVDAEPALAKLTSVKLDAKTRYHAVKLARLVAAETKHFSEQRHDLVKELGEEREPTGAERARFGPDKISEVKPAQLLEFRARIKELADVSVTIPWGPVTSSMLESYPEFTGADMLALGPLFLLEEPSTL